MNTQVGKSVGFALLMAAGLLAALFAMGVFSANGVGAAVVDTAGNTTIDLSTPDPEAEVEITIKFRVNDDIDGTPVNENVRITLPVGSAANQFKLQDEETVPTVTVMQQGVARGKATVEASSPGVITIGPSDDAASISWGL